MNKDSHDLERLAAADPELAKTVGEIIGRQRPVDTDRVSLLVDDAIWGLSQEISFGRALAKGLARLIGESPQETILYYRQKVRQRGKQGPTIGRMMALHLVPVLVHGNSGLARKFDDVFDTMCRKGSYTLKGPLEGLSTLLGSGDIASGAAYLDLLNRTFSQDINYNQSLHFTYSLPTAVASFTPPKRAWQIREFTRIVEADPSLADAFLQGRDRGLDLLSSESLHEFVGRALAQFDLSPEQGGKFLSLDSSSALKLCKEMQVAVPIGVVQHTLTRYVRARTGLSVSIQPVTSVMGSPMDLPPGQPTVFSDSRFIYLPEEIACFKNHSKNKALYLALAKLEAGLLEFDTHAFDFEKAMERVGVLDGIQHLDAGQRGQEAPGKGSDMERFFNLFPDSTKAVALFTIFEHGRIRLLLTDRYPGLVGSVFPMFKTESRRMYQAGEGDPDLLPLYHDIALGAKKPLPAGENNGLFNGVSKNIQHIFNHEICMSPVPETCAYLTVLAYHELVEAHSPDKAGRSESMAPDFPFGRHLRPDLVYNSFARFDELSRKIAEALNKKGVKAYKSDVRKKLMKNIGSISIADLQDVVVAKDDDQDGQDECPDRHNVDLSWLDLSNILKDSGIEVLDCGDGSGDVCRHREWDCHVGDYLEDYVRVTDSRIKGCGGDFYTRTLDRYAGLVKRMRHAFELLRPEGLAILRQWVEGDQFDYRALLDFALDRKAGIMPSDRLYIKRVKQQRDVAVLILVDLSRSTANSAAGSDETVLDVEKSAIVLLCEALGIVGDRFAIAGYSGTGRFGVDYIRIKDFDESVGPEIFENINAMVARRSTRMGAAIRHATRQLEKIPARVRLLIAIGDGFPNDVGYKQAYAIADTRKAIQEAVSKSIVFKAISVNIAGDPKLEELYGNLNHNVITDVTELPDKLLRIYGAMTT